MFLEKQYQLGEEVTAAFTVVVDNVLLDSLRAELASVAGLDEKSRAGVSAQELIKILPLQSFAPCLKQVRFPDAEDLDFQDLLRHQADSM